MFTTIEDYHLISTQEFSSSDYYYVYADDEDNVVGQLQTTPKSSDILEAEIPDEDVVNIMGDDIMDAMYL